MMIWHVSDVSLETVVEERMEKQCQMHLGEAREEKSSSKQSLNHDLVSKLALVSRMVIVWSWWRTYNLMYTGILLAG